ncbi:MAG: hypothetical protein Q9174_004939, partial [Haloplaca sp. 1 TL-2023]
MDYGGRPVLDFLPLRKFNSLHQPLTRLARAWSTLPSTRVESAVSYEANTAVAESSCRQGNCAMAMTAIAPLSNGVGPAAPSDRSPSPSPWEVSQYEKIMEIRDQVFAGTHPRLKLLNPLPADVPLTTPRNKGNDISLAYTSNESQPYGAASSHLPSNLTSLVTPQVPVPTASASGIDPIFLTKSDVLLRAETQQRRQRIERILADQVKDKQAMSNRPKFDQDDFPDFDVTEVLKRAQEIVKPVKFADISGANGNASASASDSFDENTFYSSQMNDSTPEHVEKPIPKQSGVCNYDANGEDCPYGEHCIFPHRSAPVQPNKGNTHSQASSGPPKSVQNPPQQTSNPSAPPAEIAAQKRIAELEAQLRALKSGNLPDNNNVSTRPHQINTRSAQEMQEEESVYSPPDAMPPQPQTYQCRRCQEKFSLKSKLDLHIAAHHTKKKFDKSPEAPVATRTRQQQRYSPAHVDQSDREFPHEIVAQSPIVNEGRVVRNGITTPVAPQPARVSPLAVARVPPIAQSQSANGASPAQSGRHQAVNPKKRRRRHESRDRARNVVARREASPEIRIKEEPVSPPPFTGALERWDQPHRPEERRPIYIDEVSPRYQHTFDRPPPRYVVEEPNLRRIVSTRQAHGAMQAGEDRHACPDDTYQVPGPRHSVARITQPTEYERERNYVRNEPSPPRSRYVEYVSPNHRQQAFDRPAEVMSPQPPMVRAPSQAYASRQEVEVPRHYRASIQPEALPLVNRNAAPSPRFREVSSMMAPPPRRIVVDQYGNQFYEQEVAPMPRPRQASVGTYPRSAGYANEFQPRRDEGMRMVEYAAPQTNGGYEELRPMEGISR